MWLIQAQGYLSHAEQSNAPMEEESGRDWQQQSLRLGLVKGCHEAVAPSPSSQSHRRC